MEKLDKTYSIEQLKDMNQTGYTVLTPKQMQLMYGKQSPFKNPKLLRTYKNMTRAEIHRSIHSTIKDVADKKLKFDVSSSLFGCKITCKNRSLHLIPLFPLFQTVLK